MVNNATMTEITAEERKFLAEMIEHHKMALVMSKKVLLSTEHSDIMSLAFSIILNQTNEIALMAEMLKSKKSRI